MSVSLSSRMTSSSRLAFAHHSKWVNDVDSVTKTSMFPVLCRSSKFDTRPEDFQGCLRKSSPYARKQRSSQVSLPRAFASTAATPPASPTPLTKDVQSGPNDSTSSGGSQAGSGGGKTKKGDSGDNDGKKQTNNAQPTTSPSVSTFATLPPSAKPVKSAPQKPKANASQSTTPTAGARSSKQQGTFGAVDDLSFSFSSQEQSDDAQAHICSERRAALKKRWQAYVVKHNLKSGPNHQIEADSPVFHFQESKSVVDTHPVLVLSCDGGGIRGIATAAAVAEIESMWKDEAQILGLKTTPTSIIQLCNWEIFTGTSTGSFVSGMLAACNASGEDIVAMYVKQAAVMTPPKTWTDTMLSKITNALNEAKYTNIGKEYVLQLALQDKWSGKQKLLNNIYEEKRQLLVCAYRIRDEPGLRVFDSEDVNDREIEVWQVCDASSAAPIFFSAAVVNNETFVDGGMALNNPTLIALNAAKIRSNNTGNRPVFVLSMGTGGKHADMGSDVGAAEAIVDGLTDFITDSWSQNYLAEQYCKSHNWNYLRIDGDLGSASQKIDDISAENISNLISVGRQWAKTRESELRVFLRAIVDCEKAAN